MLRLALGESDSGGLNVRRISQRYPEMPQIARNVPGCRPLPQSPELGWPDGGGSGREQGINVNINISLQITQVLMITEIKRLTL